MDTFLESVVGIGFNMSPTPMRDRPPLHAPLGDHAKAALSSARAVSYTHLTLPTILLV